MSDELMWKGKEQRIREELAQIAAKIPETLAVGLLDVGMMSNLIHSDHAYFDEARMNSFGGESSTCAERVCFDSSLGVWEHSILACEDGIAFTALLDNDDNYITFCLIAQPIFPADELLAAVRPHCRTLWELIR